MSDYIYFQGTPIWLYDPSTSKIGDKNTKTGADVGIFTTDSAASRAQALATGLYGETLYNWAVAQRQAVTL